MAGLFEYADLVRADLRQYVADLDDTDAFREVASWSGIESDFVFRMFLYTGAPVPKP